MQLVFYTESSQRCPYDLKFSIAHEISLGQGYSSLKQGWRYGCSGLQIFLNTSPDKEGGQEKEWHYFCIVSTSHQAAHTGYTNLQIHTSLLHSKYQVRATHEHCWETSVTIWLESWSWRFHSPPLLSCDIDNFLLQGWLTADWNSVRLSGSLKQVSQK